MSLGVEERNYIPRPLLSNNRLIAPLWADADTTNGVGTVTYGTNTDSATLTRVQQSIAAAYPDQSAFAPTYAFITTWNEIGYYFLNMDLVRD